MHPIRRKSDYLIFVNIYELIMLGMYVECIIHGLCIVRLSLIVNPRRLIGLGLRIFWKILCSMGMCIKLGLCLIITSISSNQSSIMCILYQQSHQSIPI